MKLFSSSASDGMNIYINSFLAYNCHDARILIEQSFFVQFGINAKISCAWEIPRNQIQEVMGKRISENTIDEKELSDLKLKNKLMIDLLKKFANEDFRGNRPSHSFESFNLLKVVS